MPKKKQKSPTKIIESRKNPGVEGAWIKSPGAKLEYLATNSQEGEAKLDVDIQNKYIKKGGRYSTIHTHPEGFFPGWGTPMPSWLDLEGFLISKVDTMIIAQQNKKTGKVAGYAIIKKTKKTEETLFPYMEGVKESVQEYRRKMWEINLPHIRVYEQVKNKLGIKRDYTEPLNDFAKKYGLQFKFVPTENYYFDEKVGSFRKKSKKLESKVTTSILLFIFGLFFISSNFTGYAVSNLSSASSNWIGAILFFLGVFILVWKQSK